MFQKPELLNDMIVDHNFVGLEVLLVPFAQHTSTQRLTMFCNNCSQWVLVDGCEHPLIFTGWESVIGDYEWDYTKRDHDVVIQEVIPKFDMSMGDSNMPVDYCIIYTDEVTKEINYFMLKNHQYNDDFGYIFKKMNINQLCKGSYVLKDTKFTTSPAHDGNKYMMGVNANIAVMSIPECAEDPFIISESFSKKCRHTAINSIEYNIKIDEIPLNLYGDVDTYKVFPDIGDVVNDDGIIFATRKPTELGRIFDTAPNVLNSVQMHDNIFVAPKGATVIDVEVHINSKQLKIIKDNPIYAQFYKYSQQHHRFYNNVVSAYERLVADGFKVSTNFNNFVTQCKLMQKEKFEKKIKLMNKKEHVDFITIKLVYTYKREISRSFKFTDRYGAKGVVSAIWPDDHMPVDEHGIRADVIINVDSPFNRMNTGQLDEQQLNRIGQIIQQRVINNQLGDLNSTVNYVLEFLNDVRPNWCKVVKNRLKTEQDKIEFIEDIKNEGIYLWIPPYCNLDMEKIIIDLTDKYQAHETRVQYKIKDKDGNIKIISTEDTVCIGKKYVYLLNKIPLNLSSAVSTGYVSQFGTPVKVKSDSIKHQNRVKPTPLRFGEDEISLLAMATGTDNTFRFMSLYSAAPELVKEMVKQLLSSEKPTAFNKLDVSKEEIVNNNINVSIMRHMLGIVGIDFNDYEGEVIDENS